MRKEVTICRTCGAGAESVAAAIAPGLPAGWTVRLHDCLSVCAEPVAMAVQASGKATYVFAGIGVADAADVAGFAAMYDAAADGWIADARPAGRLRFCLKARVPAP